MAVTSFAGLRGTGDFGTDERPKNFREMIMFRNPNGTTPLLGLLSRAGSSMRKIGGKTISYEPTDDPEFAWWDEGFNIVRLQVNGTTSGTSGTSVVVDSGDPSSATDAGSPYGSAFNLKAGDLLLVEKADAATFDNEIIRVESVTNATTFVVTRGAAGTTPGANIANDAWLTRIGSSYPEGSALPGSTTRKPIKFLNYTQIFRDVFDITNTAAASRYRTGDPVENDKRRKMWDHAEGIEHAFLWGSSSEVTDGGNGKPRRTTAGIRRFIPSANATVFATTPTVTTLLNAISPVFNWNTPAGDSRILLLGNTAMNAINLAITNDSKSQMNLNPNPVTVYGMRMRELILPQGTLLIKTHPLMNLHSVYTKSAFILDMSALRYRYLSHHGINRDTKSYEKTSDLEKTGDDKLTGHWLTECGLEVRYAGLTCGYLGNVTYP